MKQNSLLCPASWDVYSTLWDDMFSVSTANKTKQDLKLNCCKSAFLCREASLFFQKLGGVLKQDKVQESMARQELQEPEELKEPLF